MTLTKTIDLQMTSRRSEDRQRISAIADVLVLESPFPELVGKTYVSDVFDVSESGLRLECDELLDGCTLLITASMPGVSNSIAMRGEVLWASFEEDRSFQQGVEFKGNDSALIIRWHQMLKESID